MFRKDESWIRNTVVFKDNARKIIAVQQHVFLKNTNIDNPEFIIDKHRHLSTGAIPSAILPEIAGVSRAIFSVVLPLMEETVE